MALKVNINTGAWYGDKEMTLNFPDNWDVSVRESKDAAALDESQIAAAFAEPIGTERIKQLARGKGSAVIIVDDLRRPTPAYLVIPHIVEELKDAGISEGSIRFVIGGGSHRPLTKEEIAKKVGQDIASKYEISNHNTFSKTLEDLVNQYPISVRFLMEKGVRCLRCGEPIWGSIGEAAIEKGFTQDSLPGLIKDLKIYLKEYG